MEEHDRGKNESHRLWEVEADNTETKLSDVSGWQFLDFLVGDNTLCKSELASPTRNYPFTFVGNQMSLNTEGGPLKPKIQVCKHHTRKKEISMET